MMRFTSIYQRFIVILVVCTFISSGNISIRASTLNNNLLSNHSFETADNYSEFLPAQWLPDFWNPGADMQLVGSQVHEGMRSVQISQSEVNDSRWLQRVDVQPFTDYRLSGWIKTENVAHSADPVDAGANLCIYGTWDRTPGVFGTSEWTYVEMTFNSGDTSQIQVCARLGYWSGTTTGTAWFDDLHLEPVNPLPPPNSVTYLPLITKLPCTSASPSWKILVLLYSSTDFQFVDENGQAHHFIANLTQSDLIRIGYAVTRFANSDVPALDSCNMLPTITIRDPGHPLSNLSPMGCSDYAPSPSDASDDRDPAFDSIITLWDGSGIDLSTGQEMSLQGCAWTWPMGTGQTYVSIPADYVSYTNRNIFKHEWGHSILFYYDAAGASPEPPVDNHINDTDHQYVNCQMGSGYILQDETDLDPIPNSIYNNQSGFTRDYYSGMTATPDQPNRCLGIPPATWATGGPVTRPAQNGHPATWQSSADDTIGTATPDRWINIFSLLETRP